MSDVADLESDTLTREPQHVAVGRPRQQRWLPVGTAVLTAACVLVAVLAARNTTPGKGNPTNQARTCAVRGRRAGTIMVFGSGPDTATDTTYAMVGTGLLNKYSSTMFPPGTIERAFLDLSKPTGSAEIQIYFYATTG